MGGPFFEGTRNCKKGEGGGKREKWEGRGGSNEQDVGACLWSFTLSVVGLCAVGINDVAPGVMAFCCHVSSLLITVRVCFGGSLEGVCIL